MKWIKATQGGAYLSDNQRFIAINEQHSIDAKKKWTLVDQAEISSKGKPREYYITSLKEAKELAESIETKAPISRGELAEDIIGVTISLPPAMTGSGAIEVWLTVNALFPQGSNEVESLEGWVRFMDGSEELGCEQYFVFAEFKETDDEVFDLPPLSDLRAFRTAILNRCLKQENTVAYIRHLLEHVKNGEL